MVKIMENPIKIDDLGVPLFSETPKYIPNRGDLTPEKLTKKNKKHPSLGHWAEPGVIWKIHDII